MNDSRIENKVIEKCKEMSFQVLENYTYDLLHEIDTEEDSSETLETNKRVFKELISLLESKFRAEFSAQLKADRLLKSSNDFEKFRKSLLSKLAVKSSKNKRTTKDYLEDININNNTALALLEDLLKCLCDNIHTANTIINASAKFHEKVKLIFSLNNSEIQRIDKRFDFSRILISIAAHKQTINFIETKRLNRKKRIAQLNKNLKLNINLNFKLSKNLKEIIAEDFHELETIQKEDESYRSELGAKYNEHSRNLTFLIGGIKNNINLELQEIKENLNLKNDFETESAQNSINNLRAQEKAFFNDSSESIMTKEFLPFEIFPKGEWTSKDIVKSFKHKGLSITYEDEIRLQKIEEFFEPDECYIGKDKFDGYVVYRFNWTEIIIAEKPVYGNATYLINASWKQVIKILSQTRFEARQNYPSQVKRVFHREENQWLSQIEECLDDWN